MMAELKRKAEQRQTKVKSESGSQNMRNSGPPPSNVAPKFQPKSTPSQYVPTNNRSNTVGSRSGSGSSSTVDKEEIKKIIQEELKKMKSEFIQEFRVMIREELSQPNNH